jgi:hypothetical protein
MLMDHPLVVEALLEGDGAMQQQQELVRERGRRIMAAAELGLARSSRDRQWGRALGRQALMLPTKKDAAAAVPVARQPLTKTMTSLEASCEQDVVEEDVVVEEKVELLRHLVPGGEDMEVEGLLEETADYITALKQQVGVMRALACTLSGAGLDMLPEKADKLATATPEN